MAYAPPLEERNFWLWMLISCCTCGIGSLIYLYFNFEDLNKLDLHPKPQGVPSTHVDTLIILILIICVSGIGQIIAMYLKFEKLHEYIKYHPQKQSRDVASGLKFLLISIGGGIALGCCWSLLAIIPAIIVAMGGGTPAAMIWITIGVSIVGGILSLLFSIYVLILNYQWQEAYNERARMIMSRGRTR